MKARKENDENYDISVVDTSTSRIKSTVSLRKKKTGEEEKSGSEIDDDPK